MHALGPSKPELPSQAAGYLLHHASMDLWLIMHVVSPACLISKRSNSPASPAAMMHLHKTVATAAYREVQGNT